MRTQFRLAVGILVIILISSIATYLRWWDIHITIGAYFAHHWLSIIASAYVLIFVPLYAIMKRYTSANRAALLKLHVFGNLVAVMFISIHFAQQMGRPADFAPDLGTGLAAFILIAIITITGFILRFGLMPKKRQSWYLIHTGVGLSSLIVIIIHALRNFGLM